jgi:hypothetical protein
MTRLWCKIMPKIGVEQTKSNGNSTFIYTPWAHSSNKFFKKL